MAFGEDIRLFDRAANKVSRNRIVTLIKFVVLDPPELDLNVMDGGTEGKREKSMMFTERAGAPCLLYTWRCQYVGKSLVEGVDHFWIPIKDFETICIRYLSIRELKQAEEKIAL